MGLGCGCVRQGGLRDVAKLAGVSMGTVSNVLNRPETVRPENRAKVERAIAELGYIGSQLAVQLRSGKTRLTGVLVPDVGNPFWGTVLRGVEQELDDTGDFIVVTSTHQDVARERRALESLFQRNVDGLICALTADQTDLLRRFVESGRRVVTIERPAADPGIPSVTGDSVTGGRVAAKVLLEAGFDRLAVIGGPASVIWSANRRRGAEQEVTSWGLDPRSALVDITVPDLTAAHGELAVARLVDLFPDGGGVLCGNDLVALGVYRGLQARGLQVPSTFSVVGYDDDDFASALSPALTTVRQAPGLMGAMAAQLLGAPPDEPARHVAYTPELVQRQSVHSRAA